MQVSSDNKPLYLNQLSVYDDELKKWKNIETESKILPEARFGTKMFCYYNYLIMFGGRGINGTFFGDLWIYDIVRSYWHKIQDSSTGYDVEEGESERAPSNRAFLGGELLIKYGSAVIFGGKGEEDDAF